MADALTPSDAASVPVKTGAVILTRHGEPALSRAVRLNADEYRDWWARYEIGGLKAGQTPPEDLLAEARKADVILVSTRLRARETALAVTAGRSFAENPILIEAPLPPPHWPRWFKLSPRHWGFISRVWWYFLNQHDHEESRAEAEVRADQAAKMVADLAAEGQDVLVLAHGFFNTMVGNSLKRMGWRCAQDQGYNYWCMRRFEKK